MITHRHRPRVTRGEGSLSLALEGTDWMGHPARGCADPEDAELFFGETPAERRLAMRICQDRCPFLQQCDAFATENGEKFGVWGGRNRTAITQKDVPSGTPDDELIDAVLTTNPGQFKRLDNRLQRLVVLEGVRRDIGFGKLAHRFKERAGDLYALAHDHTIGDRIGALDEQKRTNPEIAELLGISVSSVGEYRTKGCRTVAAA